MQKESRAAGSSRWRQCRCHAARGVHWTCCACMRRADLPIQTQTHAPLYVRARM